MEGVLSEIRLLLSSFTTVLSGDTDAAKLIPSAGPDVPRDTAVFAIFTVALFTMNWGIRLLFIEPVLVRFLHPKVQKAKFTQSVIEFFIYGIFTLFGLKIVPSQEWVWPSANWWIGYDQGGHEIMRADMRCYYILYMARYAQMFLCVFMELKRKDFLQMVLHHSSTVFVIGISYVYGWNRIGVVVMLLLDPGDVPLHSAKMCKYVHDATRSSVWLFCANRLFEAFAVVFFVTRIVMFSYVCWSAHIEATRYFPKHVAEWSCVGLLYTLLLLQINWFYLIIKVAVKMLTMGEDPGDCRSDDEDEPEESDSKGKKDK